MKNIDNTTAVPPLSAIVLAAAIAGCNSAANTPASSMPGIGQTSQQQSAAVTPLKKKIACTEESIFATFNNTAIAAGNWIWFSSVFHPNNYIGRFHMARSHITIVAGTTTYDLPTPGSRISLHASQTLHLNWAAHNNIWWLMAPENTSGNDFMNAFAWQVPAPGIPGHAMVTWNAQFFSKGQHTINWQWGAAVYTQMPAGFPPDYNLIGAKPLDDNHYPPFNSDHAGTPENIKSFLIAGATGGGGSDYTGGLSSTAAVIPCLLP